LTVIISKGSKIREMKSETAKRSLNPRKEN